MGIFCKICVTQPPNNVFVPGSDVCGTIKYAFDEETSVKKICVFFTGYGRLDVTETRGSGENETKDYDINKEIYVNSDSVVLSDNQGKMFPVGAYETLFKFKLPDNVPSSLNYYNSDLTYEIRCLIRYCIVIKFEFTSLFKFNKTFESEICVSSGIVSKLSLKPVIYGERKKLFQIFGTRDSIVNLKATIEKSVVEPHGKIKVHYEVRNDTNKTVKCVETKLVEVYTFHKNHKKNSELKKYKEIDYTNSRTASIKSGETLTVPLEVNIPPNLASLDHSKIVQRDYAVAINVELPIPHSNILLFIPVQIGISNHLLVVDSAASTSAITNESPAHNDSPPTYWEVMKECNEKN